MVRYLHLVALASFTLACSDPAARKQIKSLEERVAALESRLPQPTAPTEPPTQPQQTIKVTGWRSLLWGDSPQQVAAKLPTEKVSCRPGREQIEKGNKTRTDRCQYIVADETGVDRIVTIYINDKLGRVVVAYRPFRPDDAKVSNLQRALEEKYCPLTESLNTTIRQARSGNVGQSQQVHLTCKKEGGNLYLSVQSDVEAGAIAIYWTSEEYEAFLSKNEFNNSF